MQTIVELVRQVAFAPTPCGEDSYLAKMDFIEHHLIGVADADKSGDKGENGNDGEDNLVVELITRGCALCGLCELIELLFDSSGSKVFLARDVPLAQAVLGIRA